jgi:hypothetical protein
MPYEEETLNLSKGKSMIRASITQSVRQQGLLTGFVLCSSDILLNTGGLVSLSE